MKNQVLVRSVIGLISILALYGGYSLLREWLKDPDIGSLDSSDMVAAVEYVEDGSQIVVFDKKGNKTIVSDYKMATADIEPVWRPDGQRIFFASDRGGQSNSIYRWNIVDNTAEQRSFGTRSEGALSFGPAGWPGLMNSGLITAGGTVQEFDQRERRTKQILPPIEFGGTTTEEMQQDIAGRYQKIGTSFKEARWGKDRKVIYSVMRREDDEVFVVNYMEKIGEANVGPVQLLAGDAIQFDVAPDGTAVVAIQNFSFPDPDQVPPQFIKDGKILTPFRNSVATIRIGENGAPVMEQVFTDSVDVGIDPRELNAENRARYKIPSAIDGLVAFQVPEGGPAHSIGMQVGDVLMSINGTKCSSPEALFNATMKILIGESATITYYSTKAGSSGVKTMEYEFGSEPTTLLKDVAVSPDSKWIAVTIGRLADRYSFIAFRLGIIPLKQGGISELKALIDAPVFEPSWSPDGKRLVYTKIGPSGDSQIFTINADGSDERNLSGPGDYGSPRFSPMIKK